MPDLGRIALTKKQIAATEIALYRSADQINRLLADGIPYTKIVAPVPYQQPPPAPPELAPKGWAYGGETGGQ